MLVIKRLNNFGVKHPGAVAALGSFDGLHLGHRAIIKKLVARAKKIGHDSVVITFDPHPRQVLSQDRTPCLLTALSEKQQILETLGVGVMAVIKFSPRVAALSPEEFIRSVMVKKLAVSEVICGNDCGFGAGRKGNINTLRELGAKMGFKVSVLSSLKTNGSKISSSCIRDLISSGKIGKANKMLGRVYSVRGMVVKGLGLGRKLGFPTANIRSSDPQKLLPRDGVYAAGARIGRREYQGMLYIGRRLTVGRSARTIEFNAFGGKYDLSGKKAEMFFHKFIRPGKKYGTVEALIRAIERDQGKIERYFETGLSY
ncbi:MAG: bifunctional riboflavin kinase/FAD synthetase [Candidatus Edwardsbacteria bacterium]|nr:bifunctional riboflavin kinase/FAD synthetase [Candidatus Edwardsbacteria bacterium]